MLVYDTCRKEMYADGTLCDEHLPPVGHKGMLWLRVMNGAREEIEE
jgi:hypothetical protein